jgi:6-phospho-3-hexuloisomerase
MKKVAKAAKGTERPQTTRLIHEGIRLALGEIESVLMHVDQESVMRMVKVLRKARRIVTIGAGRVGLATKGFAMRLGHLGFAAYALGDMGVPALGAAGDVVVVASGSGETPTIAVLAETSKESGATLILLTANPASRMGRIADVVVQIPAPNKATQGRVSSRQPMTTLNEQCLQIFFDSLVLVLMQELGETAKSMHARHSNLE